MELLEGGPYPFLSPPEIQPLVVINEVLARGGGGGMNGARHWDPFEIGEAEYEELADALAHSGRFARVDVPAWVRSQDDWFVWCMQRKRGVPLDEHRRLKGEARRRQTAYEAATNDTSISRDQRAELYLASARAGDEERRFLAPWVLAPGFGSDEYQELQARANDAANRSAAASIRGNGDGIRQAEVDLEEATGRLDEATNEIIRRNAGDKSPEQPGPDEDAAGD